MHSCRLQPRRALQHVCVPLSLVVASLSLAQTDTNVTGNLTVAGGASIGTPAVVPGLTLAGGSSVANLNPNTTGAEVDYSGQSITFRQAFFTGGHFNLGMIKMVQPQGTYLDNGAMTFSVGGSGTLIERLRLAANGNVGIGTKNPISKFHVVSGAVPLQGADYFGSAGHFEAPNYNFTTQSGAVSSTLTVGSNSALAVGAGGTIALSGKYTGDSMADWAMIKGGKENGGDGNYAGYLAFGTHTHAGGVGERMRIDSVGNVGIGTTAPGAKLDIYAGGTALGQSTDVLTIASVPNTVANANGTGLLFKTTRNDGAGVNTTNAARIYTYLTDGTNGAENNDLKFQTSRAGTLTDAITIKSDGGVVVGTPWAELGLKFQVGGDAAFAHVTSKSASGYPAYVGYQLGAGFSQNVNAVFHGITDNVNTSGAVGLNWLIRGYRGSTFKWGVDFDGFIDWNDDTFLYRSAAGTLKTDGAFSAASLTVGGVAFGSPSDYVKTSGGSALSVTNLTSTGVITASGGTITGSSTSGLAISSGGAGKDIVLATTGTGKTTILGGNVGIGTIGEERLDVMGRIQARSMTNTAGTSSWFSVGSIQEISGYGVALGMYVENALSNKYALTFGTKPDSGVPITERMRISGDGNVFIGVTNAGYYATANTAGYKLSVEGKMHAKEVVVDSDAASWSDYVFADNYRNAPLSEVEQHIKAHKHLPGIPSAAEVEEKGVNLGKMQSLLLAKVEELTLHLIEQEKSAKAQALRLSEQEQRLARLEQENAALRAAR